MHLFSAVTIQLPKKTHFFLLKRLYFFLLFWKRICVPGQEIFYQGAHIRVPLNPARAASASASDRTSETTLTSSKFRSFRSLLLSFTCHTVLAHTSNVSILSFLSSSASLYNAIELSNRFSIEILSSSFPNSPMQIFSLLRVIPLLVFLSDRKDTE